MTDGPRVAPLPTEQWAPEMKDALAALRPETSRHPRPLRGGGRPNGMNAINTLAHHPGLTKGFHALTGHILFNTTMTLRQRELVILRVASQRGSEYEWLQHVVLGMDNGLAREEIAAIETPNDAVTWSSLEAAMLDAVDQLIDDAKIATSTWDVLAAELDEQQLMDLIFTVGAYDALAMLFRSFEVEVDEDLQTWYANFQAGGESGPPKPYR